ncbi:MAG: RNA polymerase sigma factor SigZ [Sedimenticola sp.]|nr:MAG: RNA polymerase sigma factor SigZ [Sedimenticola sp.]
MKVTENIWHEYQSRLAAFIRSRVAEDAVDDLLQDVFMKIHLRIDSLKDDTKLESWLYQITRNEITDFYRNKRTLEELPEWIEQPQPEEEENIRYELSACLEPMVKELPDKYRSAIQLSEMKNRTQQEVAELEGISLSGAKSRVQRGRALLKTMLNDCCQFALNHKNQVVSYDRKDSDCKFC